MRTNDVRPPNQLFKSTPLLHMACLVLANQLPSAIRGPIQTWIGNPEHQEVTRLQAREFLVLIRKELNAKGIPHDWGNRNLGAVKIVNEEVGKLSDPKFPNLEHRETPNGESKQEMNELDLGRGVVLSANAEKERAAFQEVETLWAGPEIYRKIKRKSPA